MSSSRNAVTHGIHTSVLVLRNGNEPEYQRIEAEHLASGIPSAPSSASSWTNHRRRVAPPPHLADRDRRHRPPDGPRRPRSPKGTPHLRRARPRRCRPYPMSDESLFLSNMHRYEVRFTRQLDRSSARLAALQEKRRPQRRASPRPPGEYTRFCKTRRYRRPPSDRHLQNLLDARAPASTSHPKKSAERETDQTSEEWVHTRGIILRVLGNFPDALEAIREALAAAPRACPKELYEPA